MQSQVTDAAGTLVYQGQAGHSYQFLVLGTDKAGNRETPPFGVHAPQADVPTNLGTLPTVGKRRPPTSESADSQRPSLRRIRSSRSPSSRFPRLLRLAAS